MTKSEAVRTVKLANSRLKPVADICVRIACQRDNRSLQKLQKLVLERLDRELTPEDSEGPALLKAVDAFWKEFFAGADPQRQIDLANKVHVAVRQVQTDRWSRLESQYGKVGHYFDSFGQIKRQYRKPKGNVEDEEIEEEIELPPVKGCAIVTAAMLSAIVLLIWLVV